MLTMGRELDRFSFSFFLEYFNIRVYIFICNLLYLINILNIDVASDADMLTMK
jgi:hypothetical protein